jgi:hypothetical protein
MSNGVFMSARTGIYVLLIVAFLSPAALRAQSRDAPAGIWMSAGIGGGWARVACSICNPRRQLGPSGYVRIGTSIGPGLLIGAEANAWTRQRTDGDENARDWTHAIGAVAYLYPRADGPLYVKGGLGYIGYHADPDASTRNLGLQLGAGYEFRLGSSLRINNYLNLIASSFGSLRNDESQVVDDVSITLLQIGVGLTRR